MPTFELDHATDEQRNRYFIIHGSLPKGLNPGYGYPICDSINRHHCISPEEDEAHGEMILEALNGMELLKTACADALSHLRVAHKQSTPQDDCIIMGHVWDAIEILAKALGQKREIEAE